MLQQENNIAIVSPAQNAYSETFIQAQKNNLSGKVFYYYDGKPPKKLEGFGVLLRKQDALVFKIKKKLKLTYFSLFEQAFIKSLRQNKIQVIIAQYGPTAHFIADICSFLKIPLITHFHGYDASVYNVISDFNNYKKVFEKSAKVIAVSKVMEAKLLDLGCPKEKLIYNVYGPQKEFESITPNFSKKQFLSVGRFTDKKAPYYTILAFNEVVNRYREAKLLMAGDGALLNSCKNLVNYLGINDNVKFIGVVDKQGLIDLLKESLAFVQHSIVGGNGDMEGTPVVILEASMAGLPVISTNHAGIPDVVIHNETGFLVDEHDVEGMGKYMLKIYEDSTLARQFGLSGKERIKKHYSIDNYINTLDAVVKQSFENNI